MTTFWVFADLYRHDALWFCSMLLMLGMGFWGGYMLGKEHKQPRDENGRFTK